MVETRTDAELLAQTSQLPELFAIVFDRHFATIHRYLERRVGREGAGPSGLAFTSPTRASEKGSAGGLERAPRPHRHRHPAFAHP
jgi:hypothetical protein